MGKFTLIALLVSLLFITCKKNPKIVDRAPIYFKSIASEHSGLEFENKLLEKDDLNIIEYLYYYNGGGVATGDINNDGLDDIYFTANQLPDRLYLNLGNLKFKDITASAKIKIDSTWSSGVTMDDVNNDGYIDIYVSKVGNYKSLKAHNLLYLNNGDETFTESSELVGLNFSGFSTQASFFDYDKDGDLDMYLLNHSIHSTRSYGNAQKRMESDSLSGDRLYENKMENGTLLFEDVTEQAGIYSSALGYGLALVAADVNKDGWVDVYVGNDFHENDYLYINQGNKTFKEEGANFFNHTSRFTMGADISDMNNDGRPDIFTLDMMPFNSEIFMKSGGEDSDNVSLIKENFGFGKQYARNTFQINNGPSFSDIALMTNTYATDWSWSVLLNDYDNDGLKDLFITNGIYKRPNDLDYINFLSNIDFSVYDQSKSKEVEKKLIESMPSLKIPNVIFRNKGDFEFQELTDQSGMAPSYSNGAASSDLDKDGDLDLIVNNINEKAFLLENRSTDEKTHNWLGINLTGNKNYPVTTASKVVVYADGKEFYEELITSRGFQSSSSKKLHFGLGSAKKIDSIRIIWPDSQTQLIAELAMNQYHTVTKDTRPFLYVSRAEGTKFVITEFPYNHIENNHLDYEREPLMPERLSIEGPAMVAADFNSDGLEDLYIGGGNLEAPALFLKEKNGEYHRRDIPAFNVDNQYEDIDAVSFDLENDGDLDIYVVSGGNEKVEGDPYLEDRIYLNDGKGNFERFQSILPKFNGGSVSSADFNGDGYSDLFIGNRSIPGAYGLSPFSLILKNTGKGSFEMIQKTRFGMVTDSKWADLNNDGKPDLIIVGDWMPVTVLINNGDTTFTNETKNLGLANTSGMWNTILVADLDGNGYQDIIGGNAGLNLKWKATTDNPLKLYLDDFDKNEQLDPIIYYDFFGSEVPFASKDNLMRQLPNLKKKFLSYGDFSKIKSLKDLTDKSLDSILETKQIEELRSMVFYNSGKGFTPAPLPTEAQMSSIEALYLDMDNGNPRLLFGGNYVGYVNELGDSDANAGGVLSGFKEGIFNKYEQLPLPKNLSIRKILKIGNRQYLWISNNDKAYTIQIREPLDL